MRNLCLLLLFASLFLGSCAARRGVLESPNKGPYVNNKTNSNKPPSGSKGGTSLSGLDYIERYREIAVKEMNTYGIPASIKLAQALLESGNGNSYLALQANNHFGIKCGGVWKGRSVTRPDDHVNDCFRVYDNPEQSFRDHSEFLLRKRYERLFKLRKDDYRGWARGLKDAGYATNPRYPELLINLIERYELHRFDRAETSYIAQEKREEKVEEIIVHKEEEKTTVKPEDIKPALAMVIYEVKASDTLFKISREFNTSVEALRQANALSSDDISVGQLLVIAQ